MKYLGDSFSVFPGSEKNYRDNYDRIFGKKPEKPDPWADDRETGLERPKQMSDLPPPRDAQPAKEPMKRVRKTKKKSKNEKIKTKKK